MSDDINIGDVTISSSGGGVYKLFHPQMSEAETVRGKEAAEQRAQTIHDHYAQLMAAQAQTQVATPADDEDAPLEQGELQASGNRLSELELLRRELALAHRERDMERAEKEAAASKLAIATANADVENPKSESAIPASVPRHYKDTMSDEAREALRQSGVDTADITLEESSEIPPTGLFIGHNGRSYMIQPGVRVTVPAFLLGVLDDAVMSAPIVNEQNRVTGYRSRRRFPYIRH